MSDPAIGLIELASIAYGLLTIDAMVKESPVEVPEGR
jgi:microcompartment protein CcmL/EutN